MVFKQAAVNTWLTVEAAYQQALISQNLTALAQLQANFGAVQRRAEQLLQLPHAGIAIWAAGTPERSSRRRRPAAA